MPDEGNDRSFTRADIFGVVSIVISIGFGILPYFHPPDPAHRWSVDFIFRTVSFPLWKTVVGGVAGMLGAFQLGRKRMFDTELTRKPSREDTLKVPLIIRPTKTQPAPPHVAQAEALHDALIIEMPDDLVVHIEHYSFQNTVGLRAYVDNNRISPIYSVIYWINSAQSFDSEHKAFREGEVFNRVRIVHPQSIGPRDSSAKAWLFRKDPSCPYLLADNDMSHPLMWPNNDKSEIQRWLLNVVISVQIKPRLHPNDGLDLVTTENLIVLSWSPTTNLFKLEEHKDR